MARDNVLDLSLVARGHDHPVAALEQDDESSRPNPVEQPVMNQTGLEGASAMTASHVGSGEGVSFTTSPGSATLAVSTCVDHVD